MLFYKPSGYKERISDVKRAMEMVCYHIGNINKLFYKSPINTSSTREPSCLTNQPNGRDYLVVSINKIVLTELNDNFMGIQLDETKF